MIFTLKSNAPDLAYDNHGYQYLTDNLYEYLHTLSSEQVSVTKVHGVFRVCFAHEDDAIMFKMVFAESIK